MVRFTATIKRFSNQGEKTGWTYIEIPDDAIRQLKPATKTSFRVKGQLDDFEIEKVALLPMGGGKYILTLNAVIRKGIKKVKGAEVEARLEADEAPLVVNSDLMECLADEPAALKTFKAITRSHQLYFSRWIESAKTEPTKAKRIAMAINALSKGRGFPEMLRAHKKEKEEFGL
jgi:hypothetical protein